MGGITTNVYFYDSAFLQTHRLGTDEMEKALLVYGLLMKKRADYFVCSSENKVKVMATFGCFFQETCGQIVRAK